MPAKRNKQSSHIVVAIILFSLAIILVFPVRIALNNAREKARRISCASNLKAMGLGLEMYSNDYGGYLPNKSGAAGFEQLRSLDYITDYKIFVCPSDEKAIVGSGCQPLTEANVSYVYRGGLTKKDSADSAVYWDKPRNHKGFYNVMFLDGSVEGVPEPITSQQTPVLKKLKTHHP